MAESDLAKNVITPWAYGLFGMFNPYANQLDAAKLYGPQMGGVPMSANGPNINYPSGMFDSWMNQQPSSGNLATGQGGYYPGQAQSYYGGPPQQGYGQQMPYGQQGYGGQQMPYGQQMGAPSGNAMVGGQSGPYMMQDWMSQYQNLGLNRGLQAPQSAEETLARTALGGRFSQANSEYDTFMQSGANGSAQARAWSGAKLGGFDGNGSFIGGKNSGLYKEASANLGIVKDGGAFGGYNDPKKWADSAEDYGQYAQNMMLNDNPYRDPGKWGDSILPINVQGVQDANAIASSAPGAAMQALSGLNDYTRGLSQDPTKAGAGMGNSILPLAAWRQGETNSNFGNAMRDGQQTVDPYLNNRMDQATGMWQKGNDAGFRFAQQRDQMGYDPNALASQGVSDITGQNNQYANALMSNIDAQTRRTLAQQTPEVAAAMAAAGYGESGSGQAAMGDLMSSIMEKANESKQSTLANLTESNLGRQAQAIGQRTSVGAQNASDVLNTQSSLYQNAYNQREQARNLGMQLGAGSAADLYRQAYGSREQSNDLMYQTAAGLQGQAYMGAQNDAGNLLSQQYGATANNVGAMQQQAWGARDRMLSQQYGQTTGMIQAGLQNNQQMRAQLGMGLYNGSTSLLGQGLQANNDRGNLLAQLQNNALYQSESAQQTRAMNQFALNQGGQNMQTQLWNGREANYNNRLNATVAAGRSYQDYEQQFRNQVADQLLLPYKTGLQVTTGINTSPVPTPYRVDPWTQGGIQAGGQILGGLLGGNNRGAAVDPYGLN